jgi:hypothetical protein
MEIFEVFFNDPTQTAKQTPHPETVLEGDLESGRSETDSASPAKKSEEAVDVRWDVPESVLDAMMEDDAREAPPSMLRQCGRNSSVVA